RSGRRGGGHRRGQPAQTGTGSRRAARDRCDHPGRVPQAHREGRRPGEAFPACSGRSAFCRGHDQHSRGLREKYEVHHGVRIKDTAIVAAAVLSNRYITDRFLPDKAIDLIDEAAARLRTEIDSLPAELDELERQIRQLEIEREALKKETDKASKERLKAIEKQLAQLGEQRTALRSRWDQEKQVIGQIRQLKAKLEEVRTDADRAERAADFAKAAELRYGKAVELEKQLEEANKRLAQLQGGHALLKEEVDEEDIAEIVARWTHIPVSKLMEGEVAKLIQMEE